MERLLDEAAALHTRTQDPSVDAQAQEKMQREYNDVRDSAEERLSLLQKIAEEHQTYQGCVQRFQSWLLSKTRELTELMERDESAENKLQALKILDDSVASEEKTLLHIETLSEAVRANTSPAGAEQVAEEAEELRLGWQRLRQGLCEAEEGLRASLDSHRQYMSRCQRLGEDITRLRQLLLSLDQELEEGRQPGDPAGHTEEQMVGQWRTYTGVKNTLVGEESQVEHLKSQLKDLFRFSEDSRHLSDDVLAVVKEHQSVKCRASRLCSESESGLRGALQDPLLFFSQWSLQVSQALEAKVIDFSHIALLVQKIERLLRDSAELQERLSLLQVKGDLLDSVFGRERSDSLQTELSAAIRNRELLHSQLVQRKSRLQGLLSRTKDFGDAYELIHSRLMALKDQLGTADGLQPDILTKKSQSDQFRVIQKDLEDCEAHITALETLVSSSPNNRTQFERLFSEWKNLYTVVKRKVHDSEENIAEHESFHDSLLNMEKWIMIMKQKLESFHSSSGECSVEGRQQEAEKVLGEFPEKELQLQRLEAQTHAVLVKTSEEGRVHIERDIDRLRASWMSLCNTSLNLDRLLRFSTEQTEADSWKLKGLSEADFLMRENILVNTGSSRSPTSWNEQSGDMYPTHGILEPEGSLELEFEEDDFIGQSSWVEGQPQGRFAASVENKRHPRLSNTRTDTGTTYSGDETDSSTWILHQRKGQSLTKDVIVDSVSAVDDLGVGNGRSTSSVACGGGAVLSGDGTGAISASVGMGEEGGLRYRGGSAEVVADDVSHGGGGAFVLFRRRTSSRGTQPSSALFESAAQQEMGERAATGNLQTLGALTHTDDDKQRGALREQYRLRWSEFEEWFRKENAVLSDVLKSASGPMSAEELKINQGKIQTLRTNLPHGCELFQQLRTNFDMPDDPELLEGMEDLRYRWMLYKSKLKSLDLAPSVVSREKTQKTSQSKPQKKPGLLYRVCCMALPLWLLLLALLLLAFMLPIADESSSCSLSNNFARSFNIMLRYQGPPPT